jgi:hypothetical protein
MKLKKLSIQIKNIFLIAIGLMTICLFESCSRKISFQTSSIVPAAEGTVKVKTDKNNNYTIEVDLLNLSEPDRLQPPKKTYVVWMETDEAFVKNIGQINSSTGFLSKRLKSSFETVSSIKPTKIFITAEDDGAVQYPGMKVLTTAGF